MIIINRIYENLVGRQNVFVLFLVYIAAGRGFEACQGAESGPRTRQGKFLLVYVMKQSNHTLVWIRVQPVWFTRASASMQAPFTAS